MVVKVVELVGSSTSNWQDAAQKAVDEASQNVTSITGLEICNFTASVRDGRITEYKANVKVAYAGN